MNRFVMLLSIFLVGCASLDHVYSPFVSDDEFVERQDSMEEQLDNAGAHYELSLVPQKDGHYEVVFKSTNIVDVAPLEGMPIEQLELPFEMITNGVQVLRTMSHLTLINGYDPKLFWESYDNNVVLSNHAMPPQVVEVPSKLLPHIKEPDFLALQDRLRSIEQILKGRDYIIEHFRDEQRLAKTGFDYLKSTYIESSESGYKRDVYRYTYRDITGFHGSPFQEIVIWYYYEAPDYERKGTKVYKVFTGPENGYL